MKTLLTRTILAVGFAGSLGLGAVALAESSSPSTPPPSQPTSAAQAGGPSVHPGAVAQSLHRQALRRMRMRRLARRLQLTEPQRAAAGQLHEKAIAEIRTARADPTLTKDQKVARIRATVQAGRADFVNLLTPDQRAKLDRIESRRECRLTGP